MVTESSDAGAIYGGRDWTEQGTIIRYNYIHDVGASSNDTVGVYLDDMISGTTIYGNVFENVPTSIQHCGRYDLVDNNIMIASGKPVRIGTWGAGNAGPGGSLEARLAEVPYQQEPWSSRYPNLLTILQDEEALPKYDTVVRNAYVASGPAEIASAAVPTATIAANWAVADTAGVGFVDAAAHDYQLTSKAPIFAAIHGFAPIPFDQIGIVRVSSQFAALLGTVDAYARAGELSASAATALKVEVKLARAAAGVSGPAAATALKAVTATLTVLNKGKKLGDVATQLLSRQVDALRSHWVPDALTRVDLHGTAGTVGVGHSVQVWPSADLLSGTFADTRAAGTYSTSDATVATVGAAGDVSGIGAGSVTVGYSATLGGVTKTAAAPVTVQGKLLTGITATASDRTPVVGDTPTISVIATYSDGSTATLTPADLTFSSDDPAIASITGSGQVTAVASGVTNVQVLASIGGESATTTVNLLVSPASGSSVPSPWLVKNYGTANGYATWAASTLTVVSDGANIWDRNDDYTFVYRPASALQTVQATVQSIAEIGSTDEAVGIMVRDHDAPDSRNVNLRVTPSGLLVTWRSADGGTTDYLSAKSGAFPTGLKIVRNGDDFSTYYKAQGDWVFVNTVTVAMGADVLAGTTLFTSVKDTATVATLTDIQVDGTPLQ